MLKRQSGLAVERIKTWATQQDGSAEDFIATLFERLPASESCLPRTHPDRDDFAKT